MQPLILSDLSGHAGRLARAVLGGLTLSCALVTSAFGFALIADPQTGDIAGNLRIAARWSPEPDPFGYGTGFHDGLQVAVASDFAEKLDVTSPEDIALLREVIRHAFEAWETPDVRFDVDFDRVPVEGTSPLVDSGFEFDLFAVSSSHPAFHDTAYFGITFPHSEFAAIRLLSNGQRFDGYVITGVDIYINVNLVLDFGAFLPPERHAAALQRFLMHEIGHGLGLGHPNTYDAVFSNYDTDTNPFNLMPIDPNDPFTGLIYSPNRNAQAIMSNDRSHPGPFLFFTELQYDDRGGRDALYPSLRTCPGDCSGDGRVDVAEIITAVNIALESAPLDRCIHADGNGDGSVSIDEIVRAVGATLNGCDATAVR